MKDGEKVAREKKEIESDQIGQGIVHEDGWRRAQHACAPGCSVGADFHGDSDTYSTKYRQLGKAR